MTISRKYSAVVMFVAFTSLANSVVGQEEIDADELLRCEEAKQAQPALPQMKIMSCEEIVRSSKPRQTES